MSINPSFPPACRLRHAQHGADRLCRQCQWSAAAARVVRGDAGRPGRGLCIGPLDELTIFVWRNPELGAKVQVRPDGRITTPLITDMPAVGKTPAMLAEDIKLAAFAVHPGPAGLGDRQQVRRHLQPAGPDRRRDRKAGLAALSRQHDAARRDDRGWRPVSEYAAGNRAKLIRFDKASGKQKEYRDPAGRSAQEGRQQGQRHADAR
jgi:polysaccharide export outer membrane protein